MYPHPDRKVKFQPRHDQLESRRLLSQAGANIPGATLLQSTNWSGYVANLSSQAPNSVTAVSGSWVVPTVTGSRHGSSYSSVWVGIDGYSDSTVEQAGTEQDVINGVPQYRAWWEMYSSGLQQPEQVISMTIQPGDKITASVQYAGSGNFVLTIKDTTRNELFTTTKNTTTTQSPTAQRSSAEWIVEAPGVGGRQASLANFGSVTFSNASATIDPGTGQVTGPISDPAWQNEVIDMVTNYGTLLDSTSSLDSTGTQFTVTYVGFSGWGGGQNGSGRAHSLMVSNEPRLAHSSDR
jgi:hypothetical protein